MILKIWVMETCELRKNWTKNFIHPHEVCFSDISTKQYLEKLKWNLIHVTWNEKQMEKLKRALCKSNNNKRNKSHKRRKLCFNPRTSLNGNTDHLWLCFFCFFFNFLSNIASILYKSLMETQLLTSHKPVICIKKSLSNKYNN